MIIKRLGKIRGFQWIQIRFKTTILLNGDVFPLKTLYSTNA